MKITYNKSKIMRLANHYVKYRGYSRSLALKLAWNEAKRNEFYMIVVKLQPKRSNTPEVNISTPEMVRAMSSFYNGYGYKGD